MKVRVQIPKEYYDTYRRFGGISFVANKLVDLVTTGRLDPGTMRPVQHLSDNLIGRTIWINNPEFESIVAERGPSSPYVSINRYLYNFVENELYLEFPDEFSYDESKRSLSSLYGELTLDNLLHKGDKNEQT